VLDTSLALRCVRALDMILEVWGRLLGATRARAVEFKNLPCIGRSHGIHAEPVTFGLKILSWAEELERSYQRLQTAREAIAYGQISGAVGTYNTVDPEVERRAMDALGLRVEPVSTQIVPRDRHAEVASDLALAAAAIERIATEIRGLQKTETREVEEPFGKGQKGSSVMPHKRNPIKCENLVGLARIVRANAGVALENVTTWHERDISHSSTERVALADSFILVHFMAHRMLGIVEGMHVYPENMARNLDHTNGLVFSSRVLERLISGGVIRSKAYVLVQRTAMRCWESGEPFQAVLAADPEILEVLSEEQLAEAFDIRNVLRHVDTIFDRALGQAASGAQTSTTDTPDATSGALEQA
jgi:adenylosuccinate lyase